MQRRMLILIILTAIMCICGCATNTHITKLPKPDELKNNLVTLKTEYPDLTRYSSSGRDWFLVVYAMPESDPLIEAWNQPHRKRLSWWMLSPLQWIFHPTTCWFWEYEDKIIMARIDRPLAFGYKPHVWKLTIEEKK